MSDRPSNPPPATGDALSALKAMRQTPGFNKMPKIPRTKPKGIPDVSRSIPESTPAENPTTTTDLTGDQLAADLSATNLSATTLFASVQPSTSVGPSTAAPSIGPTPPQTASGSMSMASTFTTMMPRGPAMPPAPSLPTPSFSSKPPSSSAHPIDSSTSSSAVPGLMLPINEAGGSSSSQAPAPSSQGSSAVAALKAMKMGKRPPPKAIIPKPKPKAPPEGEEGGPLSGMTAGDTPPPATTGSLAALKMMQLGKSLSRDKLSTDKLGRGISQDLIDLADDPVQDKEPVKEQHSLSWLTSGFEPIPEKRKISLSSAGLGQKDFTALPVDIGDTGPESFASRFVNDRSASNTSLGDSMVLPEGIKANKIENMRPTSRGSDKGVKNKADDGMITIDVADDENLNEGEYKKKAKKQVPVTKPKSLTAEEPMETEESNKVNAKDCGMLFRRSDKLLDAEPGVDLSKTPSKEKEALTLSPTLPPPPKDRIPDRGRDLKSRESVKSAGSEGPKVPLIMPPLPAAEEPLFRRSEILLSAREAELMEATNSTDLPPPPPKMVELPPSPTAAGARSTEDELPSAYRKKQEAKERREKELTERRERLQKRKAEKEAREAKLKPAKEAEVPLPPAVVAVVSPDQPAIPLGGTQSLASSAEPPNVPFGSKVAEADRAMREEKKSKKTASKQESVSPKADPLSLLKADADETKISKDKPKLSDLKGTVDHFPAPPTDLFPPLPASNTQFPAPPSRGSDTFGAPSPASKSSARVLANMKAADPLMALDESKKSETELANSGAFTPKATKKGDEITLSDTIPRPGTAESQKGMSLLQFELPMGRSPTQMSEPKWVPGKAPPTPPPSKMPPNIPPKSPFDVMPPPSFAPPVGTTSTVPPPPKMAAPKLATKTTIPSFKTVVKTGSGEPQAGTPREKDYKPPESIEATMALLPKSKQSRRPSQIQTADSQTSIEAPLTSSAIGTTPQKPMRQRSFKAVPLGLAPRTPAAVPPPPPVVDLELSGMFTGKVPPPPLAAPPSASDSRAPSRVGLVPPPPPPTAQPTASRRSDSVGRGVVPPPPPLVPMGEPPSKKDKVKKALTPSDVKKVYQRFLKLEKPLDCVHVTAKEAHQILDGIHCLSWDAMIINNQVNVRVLIVFLSAHTKVKRKTQLRFAALFLGDPKDEGALTPEIAETIKQGHAAYGHAFKDQEDDLDQEKDKTHTSNIELSTALNEMDITSFFNGRKSVPIEEYIERIIPGEKKGVPKQTFKPEPPLLPITPKADLTLGKSASTASAVAASVAAPKSIPLLPVAKFTKKSDVLGKSLSKPTPAQDSAELKDSYAPRTPAASAILGEDDGDGGRMSLGASQGGGISATPTATRKAQPSFMTRDVARKKQGISAEEEERLQREARGDEPDDDIPIRISGFDDSDPNDVKLKGDQGEPVKQDQDELIKEEELDLDVAVEVADSAKLDDKKGVRFPEKIEDVREIPPAMKQKIQQSLLSQTTDLGETETDAEEDLREMDELLDLRLRKRFAARAEDLPKATEEQARVLLISRRILRGDQVVGLVTEQERSYGISENEKNIYTGYKKRGKTTLNYLKMGSKIVSTDTLKTSRFKELAVHTAFEEDFNTAFATHFFKAPEDLELTVQSQIEADATGPPGDSPKKLNKYERKRRKMLGLDGSTPRSDGGATSDSSKASTASSRGARKLKKTMGKLVGKKKKKKGRERFDSPHGPSRDESATTEAETTDADDALTSSLGSSLMSGLTGSRKKRKRRSRKKSAKGENDFVIDISSGGGTTTGTEVETLAEIVMKSKRKRKGSAGGPSSRRDEKRISRESSTTTATTAAETVESHAGLLNRGNDDDLFSDEDEDEFLRRTTEENQGVPTADDYEAEIRLWAAWKFLPCTSGANNGIRLISLLSLAATLCGVYVFVYGYEKSDFRNQSDKQMWRIISFSGLILAMISCGLFSVVSCCFRFNMNRGMNRGRGTGSASGGNSPLLADFRSRNLPTVEPRMVLERQADFERLQAMSDQQTLLLTANLKGKDKKRALRKLKKLQKQHLKEVGAEDPDIIEEERAIRATVFGKSGSLDSVDEKETTADGSRRVQMYKARVELIQKYKMAKGDVRAKQEEARETRGVTARNMYRYAKMRLPDSPEKDAPKRQPEDEGWGDNINEYQDNFTQFKRKEEEELKNEEKRLLAEALGTSPKSGTPTGHATFAGALAKSKTIGRSKLDTVVESIAEYPKSPAHLIPQKPNNMGDDLPNCPPIGGNLGASSASIGTAKVATMRAFQIGSAPLGTSSAATPAASGNVRANVASTATAEDDGFRASQIDSAPLGKGEKAKKDDTSKKKVSPLGEKKISPLTAVGTKVGGFLNNMGENMRKQQEARTNKDKGDDHPRARSTAQRPAKPQFRAISFDQKGFT